MEKTMNSRSNRRGSTFITLILSIILIAGVLGSALAAGSSKLGTSRAAAPTIKVDRGGANPSHKPLALSGKGTAAKTRTGAGYVLHVNNETPYILDVYIDGYYEGTVGSYGDLLLDEGYGKHAGYAKAPGTDLTTSRTVVAPGEWTITD
jgi:hypothetical protein